MKNKWKTPDFFWGEEDFLEKMNTVGRDFQERNYQGDTFSSYDGVTIHYTKIKNPEEVAAIVISHGFCEFIHKYDEMIYYFYQLGYSIYFIDHRGHGFSHRDVEELDMVHIDSFQQYVRDLKVFVDQVVKVGSPDVPLLLYAHSMGGAIGALFLEEYPEIFQAAVLSSPMMQMYYGTVPAWAVKILTTWGSIARWGKKYVPGQHGFDNRYVFSTSSMLSEPRYQYMFEIRQNIPEYRTYGGTYSWIKAGLKASKKVLKNAHKVKTPVLLCQAGLDTLVQPEAQKLFAQKSVNTELVIYDDAKHEIFNAKKDTREAYYDRVFSFYKEQL